jgi:hypothetical protein
MKKSKVATKSDLPRTSPEAMAPAKHERSEEDMEREGHYDLDQLMRAEEIKGDEKRMSYVHKAVDKKSKAIRSIADLKVAGQALAHQKTEEMKAKAGQPRHKTRYPERK